MLKDFSIGLVEVSGLGDAILMLDDMCKTADVEFVATERKLGGRLVTIVVKGELTAVKASVEAGTARAKELGSFKASNIIARPHEEILPYLHLNEKKAEPIKNETATAKPKTAKSTTAKPKTTTAKRKTTAKKADNK
ncbi:MAG: BMC domain-containing protein [Clostridia bacterium]|jgi:microcompartment protein CcmL/EutN|nr:BMC domain-containing protein [Clostridia bacterium]